MPDQILTPWVDRRWTFDFPVELYPCIIERLRGTPARARRLGATCSASQCVREFERGWSIVRHMAHLTDLENLFLARLAAYEEGADVLPAADMTNAVTMARDGAMDMDAVLDELQATREATMVRLEQYPPQFFARTSWHERLGVHKRAVDTCVFFADHDDHHFALARLLVRRVEADRTTPRH